MNRILATPSGRDLRTSIEVLLVLIATWVVLGWRFDRPLEQGDATVQWIPYLNASLDTDWTHHLYRFGLLGGAQLHDAAGTLPLTQLCAALGWSATGTANASTLAIQLGFAVFGIASIEALIARDLTAPERVVATWACAFAPWLGWRIGAGHDNLLIGLLPLSATLALVLAARAGRLSGTLLVLAALAVFTGLSGLGAQTLVYSAVFGGPLVIAIVATSPAGLRWTRDHTRAALALAAGILVVLPRFAGMLAHASGDDFARGHGSQLEQLGTSSALDWLASIPWTNTSTDPLVHEHQYAIGPLIAIAVTAFRPRALVWTLLGSLAIAILFGSGTVVSDALAHIPPLDSFRVPARAVLPLVGFLPVLALAACWGRAQAPIARRLDPWAVIVVATGVIAIGGQLPAAVREPLAWLLVIGVVIAPRIPKLPAIAVPAALAAVVALGVVEFRARVEPTASPQIEDAAALRTSMVAALPDLAVPLSRIEIIGPPPPYGSSTAFASGLPSIDGQWIPTRRFLDLLGAVSNKPIDPATGVFQLGRTAMFPRLAQLYDITAVADLSAGALHRLPEPPGPAWFVSEIATATSADEVGRAWRTGDFAAQLRTTGWHLAGDPGAPASSAACAGAKVDRVSTDELGQVATIAVTTPADCTLVISTNYVATLTAAAGDTELAVFPIDVALTGVSVPRGTTEFVIGPRARIPAWTRFASLLGLLLILATLATGRRANSVR